MYVRDAFEREQWTFEQTEADQQERLKYLLRHAATRVPYYRSMWADRRKNGDQSSWEVLENWPLLDKEEVRKNPRAFLSEGFNRFCLFRSHTSGTTGKPLELWQTRESLREWYGLMEARWRRWYGVSNHDRWAILGGQLVTPVTQQKPPFWIWNRAFRQLYMSSYHISDATIPMYLDALREYRIAYLIGYTSALYSLARYVLNHDVKRVPMKVAITNAEPVSALQREAISRAFRCPVRETYGMSEAVAAASECEYGTLHLWPKVGVVEVFDGDTPLGPGEAGELVSTGLLNDAMPLIRYRIGDRGAIAPNEGSCDCGRRLPALLFVEGRQDDVLYTRSGAQIGRLDPVFKADLPVREAQIVQRSLSSVVVNIVPDHGWTSEAGHRIAEQIRHRMGDVNVAIHLVDSIPRGPNGKFRAVVREVPAEELVRAGAAR
jgi:phenylacetate-CoA ligase